MNADIIKVILALVVLVNPFSALTLFLNLTQGYSTKDRKKVAQIACITIVATVALFAFLGGGLLRFLGISVGSFQIAGGILVFLIALSMMNGGGNPAKPDGDSIHVQNSLASISVVPLAIPMMIGPGGISTVIIYASQMPSTMHKFSIVIAGVCIAVFCYACLMAAGRISRFLGDTGLNIMSRIMGMLLAAVAVEIVISGVRSVFPVLQ